MTLSTPFRGAFALLLPLCFGATHASSVAAQDAGGEDPCARGRITTVEIRNGSVFDPEATESELARWAFKTVNLLHVRTRASLIRKLILFEEGDCLDPVLLEESRSLLEGSPNMRDVEVWTEGEGEGEVRAVVQTWDTWSTQVDVGVAYDAGFNLEKVKVRERNLLGLGMRVEGTYLHRREVLRRTLAFSTPRVFSRLRADLGLTRSRGGDYTYQGFTYPFVGPRGRFSFAQAFARGRQAFTWATDGGQPFSHLLVPTRLDRFELSAATQYGDPGALTILGLSLTRELFRFGEQGELTFDADFSGGQDGAVPAAVLPQLDPRAATRVLLHLGHRRTTEYRRYVGLDAVRETQTAPMLTFASLTLGQGLPFFTPTGMSASTGQLARAHASHVRPTAGGVFYSAATAEVQREDGWRDLLAEVSVALYARTGLLPGHTFFLRASGAGGWGVERPFQLTLGGRDGVRSLAEDAYPGGRMIRFTAEDRIDPGWQPVDWADLGLTLIADVGRMWPGDAPFGVDSGWRAGVGAGLRVALPSGSRAVTRFDVMKPLGDRGYVFRITSEVNALASLFRVQDLHRSFRVPRAAEHF